MNLNIIILIYFQLFSMSSWDVARLEVALGMHVLKPTLDPAAVRMKCRRITRHKGFDSRTLVNTFYWKILYTHLYNLNIILSIVQ